MKIWDANQVYLKRQNLNILHWVIFLIRLTEEDKKEGLLKRVKNIGDKNEELLKIFNVANTVSKAAKNQQDYIYDNIFAF